MSYCPEERKTEPQGLKCQQFKKFLAVLLLVLTTSFGPRKDFLAFWLSVGGVLCRPKEGTLDVEGRVVCS